MDTAAAEAESARRAEIDRITATTARAQVAVEAAPDPQRNSTHRSMRSRFAGVVRELVEDGIEDAFAGF
jgi:hypothetical protein